VDGVCVPWTYDILKAVLVEGPAVVAAVNPGGLTESFVLWEIGATEAKVQSGRRGCLRSVDTLRKAELLPMEGTTKLLIQSDHMKHSNNQSLVVWDWGGDTFQEIRDQGTFDRFCIAAGYNPYLRCLDMFQMEDTMKVTSCTHINGVSLERSDALKYKVRWEPYYYPRGSLCRESDSIFYSGGSVTLVDPRTERVEWKWWTQHQEQKIGGLAKTSNEFVFLGTNPGCVFTLDIRSKGYQERPIEFFDSKRRRLRFVDEYADMQIQRYSHDRYVMHFVCDIYHRLTGVGQRYLEALWMVDEDLNVECVRTPSCVQSVSVLPPDVWLLNESVREYEQERLAFLLVSQRTTVVLSMRNTQVECCCGAFLLV